MGSAVPIPDLADRAAFLGAMRSVASSVTVVTTDGGAGRHGATVSAFCSVSADPPSALVCLRTDSRVARAVEANRRFCVNVLPQARQDLADRFAGRYDGLLADRFVDVAFDEGDGAGPALDCATSFSCRLQRTVDFGSHRIFIGEVACVRAGAPRPLAYLDGRYHTVVPQTAPVGGAAA